MFPLTVPSPPGGLATEAPISRTSSLDRVGIIWRKASHEDNMSRSFGVATVGSPGIASPRRPQAAHLPHPIPTPLPPYHAKPPLATSPHPRPQWSYSEVSLTLTNPDPDPNPVMLLVLLVQS